MSTINEALAQHEVKRKAALNEAAQTATSEQAEIEARTRIAESEPFKVVAARAEDMAQKAMKVTMRSSDMTEILKAQGEIKALSGLMQYYTHAEVELRTTRQQGG